MWYGGVRWRGAEGGGQPSDTTGEVVITHVWKNESKCGASRSVPLYLYFCDGVLGVQFEVCGEFEMLQVTS